MHSQLKGIFCNQIFRSEYQNFGCLFQAILGGIVCPGSPFLIFLTRGVEWKGIKGNPAACANLEAFYIMKLLLEKMLLTGPARHSLLSHCGFSWHTIFLLVVSPAHVEFGCDESFGLSPGLLRRKVDTRQTNLPETQQENRECETVETLRNQAGKWCLLEEFW